MKKLRLIAGLVIAALLFYYLFRDVNWAEVVDTIMKSDLAVLALAFALFYTTFPLRTIRWNEILKIIGSKTRFSRGNKIMFFTIFLNCLTPGKLGELYRIWSAKQLRTSHSKVMATIYVERLLDLFTILLLLNAFMLLSGVENELITKAIIISLGLTVMLLLVMVLSVLWEARMLKVFSRVLRLPGMKRFEPKLSSVLEELIKSFKLMKTRQFYKVILLSLPIWIVEPSAVYLVFNSLSINVTFPLAAFLSLLASLLTVVPITPGGLGVLEFFVLIILDYIKISKSTATSFMIMYRFLTYFSIIILGALLTPVFNPFKKASEKE